MRVTMIGAGYVGLVSGACFADFGHQVTVIDRDAGRVAALNRGEIPIFEPGLAALVEANFREGRLEFATETQRAADAEAVFIGVGTPSRRGDGHADLSFVYDAVHEIAPVLSGAAVVVTKSTVPVGTGDEIERILRERRPDAAIEVVSNPEFLREGAAIQDFKIPTASWSARKMSGRGPCWPKSTGRSISTPHRSSTSAGALPSSSNTLPT